MAKVRPGAVLNIFDLTVIYFTNPVCMPASCAPESRRHTASLYDSALPVQVALVSARRVFLDSVGTAKLTDLT